MRPTTTLFSWGFYGWGSSTRELVAAVDAVEKARGYKPPLFVDIRLQRSGRAKGFVGNEFAKVVGPSRYKWINDLGNASIGKKKRGIRIKKPRIKKPQAVSQLLDLAIDQAESRRRVIFFCACNLPGPTAAPNCHRVIVATLLLNDAAKRGLDIEIVEWPGGMPTDTFSVNVSDSDIKAYRKGKKKSLSFGDRSPSVEWLAMPHGSIIRCKSEHDCLLVAGDPPIRTRSGWNVRIVDHEN